MQRSTIFNSLKTSILKADKTWIFRMPNPNPGLRKQTRIGHSTQHTRRPIETNFQPEKA